MIWCYLDTQLNWIGNWCPLCICRLMRHYKSLTGKLTGLSSRCNLFAVNAKEYNGTLTLFEIVNRFLQSWWNPQRLVHPVHRPRPRDHPTPRGAGEKEETGAWRRGEECQNDRGAGPQRPWRQGHWCEYQQGRPKPRTVFAGSALYNQGGFILQETPVYTELKRESEEEKGLCFFLFS